MVAQSVLAAAQRLRRLEPFAIRFHGVLPRGNRVQEAGSEARLRFRVAIRLEISIGGLKDLQGYSENSQATKNATDRALIQRERGSRSKSGWPREMEDSRKDLTAERRTQTAR